MHRRGWAIGALVLVTLVVATACSSSTSTSAGGAPTATSSTTSGSEAPVDVAGESATSMSAEDFLFSPAALEGTAGQKLTITLTNDGSVPHNFSIDDQDINVTLQPGQEKDIQVTFPQSGSAPFFCSFHESSGMVGQLEVP